MRAFNFLLLLTVCYIVLDLFNKLQSGVSVLGDQTLATVLWLGGILLRVGCLALGGLVYQISRSYAKTGFLDARSVTILKISIGIAFALVGLYSMQEAFGHLWESEVLYGIKMNSGSYLFFISDFTGYFLAKMPFLILFTLPLLLLADFVKRALAVKDENESFI